MPFAARLATIRSTSAFSSNVTNRAVASYSPHASRMRGRSGAATKITFASQCLAMYAACSGVLAG